MLCDDAVLDVWPSTWAQLVEPGSTIFVRAPSVLGRTPSGVSSPARSISPARSAKGTLARPASLAARLQDLSLSTVDSASPVSFPNGAVPR